MGQEALLRAQLSLGRVYVVDVQLGNDRVILYANLLPRKLTLPPGKMMVGRLAFPLDMVPFQGMFFNFRGWDRHKGYNCLKTNEQKTNGQDWIFTVVIFSQCPPLTSHSLRCG